MYIYIYTYIYIYGAQRILGHNEQASLHHSGVYERRVCLVFKGTLKAGYNLPLKYCISGVL